MSEKKKKAPKNNNIPTTPPVAPVVEESAEKPKSDKKKLLKILIPVIVGVVVIAIILAVVLKKSKDQGGYASTTNQFVVYATDENGMALTDDAGMVVTFIADTTVVNQTTEVYVNVTDKNGAAVTDENGTQLTTKVYENVTDKNGNVLTTIAYKDKDVTLHVPVTDNSGNNVTDTAGAVVTEQVVIPQNPNEQKPGQGVVMGTTIVAFTDGSGNTATNPNNGEVYTSIVALTSNPNKVEPAPIDWKSSWGGTEADYISCIDSDSDGNFITATVTNSKNGDFAQFSSLGLATSYSVLTKYNAKGGIVWTKAIGSKSGLHVITDVVVTDDDGFYAVGYGRNVGGVVLQPSTYYDAFVYKYDKNGNEVWHKIFKTSTVDLFNAATLASDGGVIVVGSVGNNDGDAAGFGKPAKQSAPCIVKYSPSGSLAWKNIVGGNLDSFKDVCIGSDGNIFCVGNFASGTLFTCLGKTDGGIVKFSSAGKYLASTRLGGRGNDLFSGITPCKSGGVVVVGRSNSNDTDSVDSIFTGNLASRGGYDSYIIKVNNDLSVNFAKPFRGQYNDDLVDIVEKEDGSFVATGSSNSSTRDFKGITTRGGDDIVIASFDMYGNLTWARSFGGTANESAYAICLAPKGGYVIVGTTLSKNIDMAGIAQYVNGKSVGVIVKFPE